MQLRIPKVRMGSFFPTILEPRRIDQALYAVVMEAYVQGVSTRSVDDLVAALGVDSGISKSEVFWKGFMTGLKQRGLTGVRLVISDQHSGLIAALTKVFQGVAHQRCRVHFARNLLALMPKAQADNVAAAFRIVFAQNTREEVEAAWDKARDEFAARWPKTGPLMDTAKAEVLAFAAFPRAHWRKIWSTNPIERINKEIKRRSRVVGIFPNNAAIIRLVGAILLDMHDEWVAAERRYLSEGSMAKLYTTGDNELVAALDSGA